MRLNVMTKVVAGAVAMAFGGAAFANTSLTNSGDIFLNIVDFSVNGSGVETSTSYLFDTGITEAAFNPASTSYSFNLTADPNIADFLGTGSNLNYSLLATTATGSGNTKFNEFFTTNIPSSTWSALTVAKANQGMANAAIQASGAFLPTADGTTSSTSNSVALGTGTTWGTSLTEGIVSNQLLNDSTAPYGDNAAIGTPLAFYSASGGNLISFAGTWNLTDVNNQEVLQWNPVGPVPLPAPVLLLISGIGLLGVVARRGRVSV